MIANYQYYTETFGGNKFDSQASYNKFERKAELELKKYIDINADSFSSEIKDCCCSLSELYSEFSETEDRISRGVYSETVSGYSVSYGSYALGLSRFRDRIKEILELYLGDILGDAIHNAGYRGVGRHVL